jgi:sugar phosphate isomerase/epimerase
MLTRRSFIEQSAFALGALTCVDVAFAAKDTKSGPLGLPIGIQLYTVRSETAKDLDGTLKKLSDIGYREVELAGYYDKSPKELSALLKRYGLAAPSAHRGLKDVLANPDKEIDFLREMGVSYLVIPFPAVEDDRFANQPADAQKTIANSTTLDDWKWIAENLNKIAEKAKRAGLRTGYHNHNLEFRKIDGVVAYDQLLQSTDPALVSFEMDIGWVVAAGVDPLAYFKKYPKRFSMLHIKDVKKGTPTKTDVVKTDTTEVGSGQIDWKHLFGSLGNQKITHYFIEQENFDMPIFQSIEKSWQYLNKLGA